MRKRVRVHACVCVCEHRSVCMSAHVGVCATAHTSVGAFPISGFAGRYEARFLLSF